MSDIYALADRDTLESFGIEPADFAIFVEKMHIPIMQYRNKNGAYEDMRSDLEQIRNIFSGILIVNDSIELVSMADGLHLGQEDLTCIDPDPSRAISLARDAAGDKLLGISVHNPKEIETANMLDIDYIGLGAYRSSSTKTDAVVSGEKLLEYAADSKHPVAIIGGVQMDDNFPSTVRYRVIGSALCRLCMDSSF